MILKKLISVMSVFAIIVSSFTTAVVSADEEMTPIACTQSASYLTDGDGNVTQTIVNYAGKEDISNINWNTKSNSWGGVGVLEFTVPAAEAKRIKSATLTVSVHNGSKTRIVLCFPHLFLPCLLHIHELFRLIFGPCAFRPV